MPLVALEKGHIKAIADLEATLFERPFTADALTSLFARTAFAGYALRDDAENILSYIMLSQVVDEAEILSLGAARDQQGKGHARELLRATCRLLMQAGIGRLYLDVAESNVAAHALYGGCGFAATGRRPHYYGVAPNREDAIIMTKILG